MYLTGNALPYSGEFPRSLSTQDQVILAASDLLRETELALSELNRRAATLRETLATCRHSVYTEERGNYYNSRRCAVCGALMEMI